MGNIITTDELKTFGYDKQAPLNDAQWALALAAAEDAVNEHCQRQFAVAGNASARLFRPSTPELVVIDDCTSVTSVVNGGGTITSGNYQLEPINGRSQSGRAVPYTRVRLLVGTFDYGTNNIAEATITVTATWGWSAIPSAVKQATLILAADIAKSRDLRFGRQMTDVGGVRVGSNPQVVELLAPFRRGDRWGIG